MKKVGILKTNAAYAKVKNNVEAKIKALKRAAAPFVKGNGKPIHDTKIRALAKGARADEKFIERAIKDNADNYTSIMTDELKKQLGKI